MYDSGIPEYPIFQPTLKYSVALFSILVCKVQEATRLSSRKAHLGRDLGGTWGQGACPQIMACKSRWILIQFFYHIV